MQKQCIPGLGKEASSIVHAALSKRVPTRLKYYGVLDRGVGTIKSPLSNGGV